MTWALDLDGVVWLSGRPLPGAPEAVARLRAAGHRVAFLTNNSSPTVADHVATLAAAGIPAAEEEVVTSAQAAATLVPAGATVVALGGPGVHEALRARGCTIRGGGDADAVVVGLRRDLTYRMLAEAAASARRAPLFVATNDDPTYPTPTGQDPGAGAIVAAVATAAGRAPVYAGKPNAAMAALVAERLGAVEVMVGDRPTTDGLMARRMGARFALVLTGVTDAGGAAALDPPADLVAADLARAVDALAGGR